MKNLKISKKIIPILFAGTILMSLSSCNKKTKQLNSENTIGYIDTNPKKIDESEFAIYNIGNYKKTGILNQEKILKYCEKKEISIGVIIDSDATSLIDIYEDVEFTKSIIEQYKIDMPVYFSIEKIMINDDLSITTKAQYIKEYLELTEKNNIYVGLYGTSTNLSNLNLYGLPLSNNYDCFVVEDGKTKYTGLSTIRQDEEGNVYSTFESEEYQNNIANLIKENKLNDSTRLKQNEYYIVDEDNSIEQIAIINNLSINDLLMFNNITKKDIKNGTIIRIPNKIQDNKKLVYPNLIRKKQALYRGIDISHHQQLDDNMTFKKLSNYLDFVILKIGEQENNEFKIDPKFYEFYNDCYQNNIPIGGYYVTNATTKEEAINEAKSVIEQINNLKITFPIFIDFENTKGTIYEKEFNQLIENESLKEIFSELNQMFEKSDNRFGIYSNLSTYSIIEQEVGLQELNKYQIWLSNPSEYDKVNQVRDNGPICQTDNGLYSYGCDINQVSWKITDLGIGNSDGVVDFNLCYVDYKQPKELKEQQSTQVFDTKKYNRKNPKNILNIIKTTSQIAGILSISIYVIRHKKRIRKKIKRLIKVLNKKNKQKIIQR